MKYDLILITTYCNDQHIYNLIESVILYNHVLKIKLVIVNQTNTPLTAIVENIDNDIEVINYGIQVNSSIGRNIGVRHVLKNNFKSIFVAFPDDDSTFDAEYFLRLNDYIQNCDHFNRITDVFCTGTKNMYRHNSLAHGISLNKKNYNIVGAVNILLNFQTFEKVKYFDERFGVNAIYGAGEDGDYFIRAVAESKFIYDKKLYSYHPSGDEKYNSLTFQQKRERLFKYGKGVVALLCKHRMYFEANILVFRALLGAVNYFVKLKFSLSIAYFEVFFVRIYYLLKFSIFSIK